MAMNKTEVAMMERLETMLALRVTDRVDPDVEPLANGWSVGWSVFYDHVEKTFTNRNAQRRGDKEGFGSRSIEPIYSTRVKALRALRNALERKFAAELRRVDLMITKAEVEDAQPAAPQEVEA